jgi:hypothetical protein
MLTRTLALVVAPMLLVAWFAPDETVEDRIRSFDPRPLIEFRRTRPRYVLIGNSMLASRIDAKLLEDELGEPVGFLARNASASADWYLMLKNYVAAAGLDDCNVAIFYRETALTQPHLRASRRAALQSVSREDDPAVEAILRGRGSSWQQRVRIAAFAWANPQAWRSSFRDAVNRVALGEHGAVAGVDKSEFEVQRINSVFAMDGLRRSDDEPDSEPRSLARFDFAANVERSFLPHMLDLADRKGFKLWFIQVNRRLRNDGRLRPTAPALDEYTRSLRTYVESRNAGLIDLRASRLVTPEMFGRRDHIAPDHREAYTRLFPELAAAMFQGREQP